MEQERERLQLGDLSQMNGQCVYVQNKDKRTDEWYEVSTNRDGRICLWQANLPRERFNAPLDAELALLLNYEIYRSSPRDKNIAQTTVF